MGLLRTILIILLIYYGFKILSKIFAPVLFKYAAKKAEELLVVHLINNVKNQLIKKVK